MSNNSNDCSDSELRHLVYLAAERTLMSWIRTALGLMALGFVVDRLGVFLRIANRSATGELKPDVISVWAGTVLVVLGALVPVTASVRYIRFSINYHRRGDTDPRHGLLLGTFLAVLIAAVGVLIAIFLLRVSA